MFNPWRAWSPCFFGRQYRIRTVRIPARCGGTCLGARFETRLCSDGCTPTNCVLSLWGPWFACYFGVQYRFRRIITPASCGGTCTGSLQETRSCVTGCPPTNCVLSRWSSWSRCFSGVQHRYRHVITPARCGGTCTGLRHETRRCRFNACLYHPCIWYPWSPCLFGRQHRSMNPISYNYCGCYRYRQQNRHC